jgi:hypothetical protein
MNIMNRNNAGHLTDDQIDDALIGSLSRKAAGHLAVCGRCAESVAAARMPLSSFKAVSTAWSERRSATLPQVSIQDAARPQRLAWSAAVVTATLGLVIAIPVMQKHERVNEAAATSTSTLSPQMANVDAAPVVSGVMTRVDERLPRTASPDDEQISRDNQMLNVIDQELDASSGSSAALELEPVEVRTSGRNVTPTEQD